mgnify:CR=1 FL=1
MNPDTGSFHGMEDLAGKLKIVEQELQEKMGRLGWLEFQVGEILRLKGHDFKVEWIGADAFLVRSVKFVDPSAKK